MNHQIAESKLDLMHDHPSEITTTTNSTEMALDQVYTSTGSESTQRSLSSVCWTQEAAAFITSDRTRIQTQLVGTRIRPGERRRDEDTITNTLWKLNMVTDFKLSNTNDGGKFHVLELDSGLRVLFKKESKNSVYKQPENEC